MLLASGQDGVQVYDAEEQKKINTVSSTLGYEVIHLGTLEGSDHLGPLKQLHTVPSPRRVRCNWDFYLHFDLDSLPFHVIIDRMA